LSELETIATYSFRPGDLRLDARRTGISAFMRIRNGAEFLESTIRSHIESVDEVVAVYNQCTDATPEIMARLEAEYGPEKLRLIHYTHRVFPPGSLEHAAEPAESPHSFVNMSNLALSRTRYRVAMKLDDDHLAIRPRVRAVARRIRAADCRLDEILCFSGINLARDEAGQVGVLASDPLVGAGDHFFFEVTPDTHFIHDRRFEDFSHGSKQRIFADITYSHLKYLKVDFGFGNREIDKGQNPRFARKRDRFLVDRRVVSLLEVSQLAPRFLSVRAALPLLEKSRINVERWRRLTDWLSNNGGSGLADLGLAQASIPEAFLAGLGSND
jgi:hypothetical protein